jgi:hypothetical protein
MAISKNAGDRARLIRFLAFLSVGIFVLALCLRLASTDGAALVSGRIDPGKASETVLSVLLARERIGAFGPEEVRAIGDQLVRRAAARGRIPERYLASFFPSASETLAMLARDRDVDDYLENAEDDGAGGDYYQHIADLAPTMKPLRDQYEGLFLGVFSALKDLGRIKNPADYPSGSKVYEGGVTQPGLSLRPRLRDLDLTHTYALDIFFKDVQKNSLTGLECGPVILALEGGVVVAESSTWNGGEDLSDYRSGGITPNAGNGIIIYSPKSRRYYLYFHFHDVLLKAGDAVSAGQPLGHGGNTGTNARKSGHGEHLHVEVYDVASQRFLRNTEIIHLAFD